MSGKENAAAADNQDAMSAVDTAVASEPQNDGSETGQDQLE